jgi:hypothetical protein
MGIIEKYALKKLQRMEAALKRNPEIPELDTVKKVGVIWQPEQKDAVHFLHDYFSKKQVIFRSLCVLDKQVELMVDANTLSPKDLNWLKFPKYGVIDGFTKMKFDVLFNVALEQNITLDYITIHTRAKFKTGWSPNEKNYFDLNINISQNKNALYLAKQQIFYLGQLNKNRK